MESTPYTGEAGRPCSTATIAPTSRPFPKSGDGTDWKRRPAFRDGDVNALPGGVQNSYVARRLLAPSPRTLRVGLGSDDGIRVTVAGREVQESHRARHASERRHLHRGDSVGRGTASPQDREHGRRRRILLEAHRTGRDPRRRPRDGTSAERRPKRRPRGGPAESLARALLPTYTARARRVGDLEAAVAKLEASIPKTMVMRERAVPTPTFVLDRGDYAKPDKNRPVTRGIPKALGTLPEGAPADRRGLAQWFVDPSNPLVARVAVNRVWEWIFGQGLVRTSEDFGLQGDYPSHPELLDDLAVRFREGGWNLRALIREIVVSSTYRQESKVREDAVAKDPENRWLARYPRRRLDAETLRDATLAASGLLVESFGGPSVFPNNLPDFGKRSRCSCRTHASKSSRWVPIVSVEASTLFGSGPRRLPCS
jgi:hypothetical protein